MRDGKAADNAHGATARCAAFVATIVWPWPRHCLGPLALAPCRCLRRANTLKFVDIFAGRNFGLVRGTIGALPRLGRQEVVRPGRTEGYTTWPGPTGRKTFFRTRPVDRPPRGARDRYALGARHRARSGRGTRPVPIPSSQRPLTRACESEDHSSATVWS